MSDLLDYVKWRGDLSFQYYKFNEVDNIILSMLSYADFSSANIPAEMKKTTALKDFLEIHYKDKNKDYRLGLLVPNAINDLAKMLCNYNRYNDLKISNYINVESKEKRTQFSAVTFHVDKHLLYVAFSGTDDSLIGWQENIDMLSTYPTPAQKSAQEYLDRIALLYKGYDIIVGGHSKGGNLAFYAAINCKEYTKKKILKVYNNDGPGFIKERMDEGRIKSIYNRLYLITPQYSLIGSLFDDLAYVKRVVKSTNKGAMQHDPFSWKIETENFESGELDENSVNLTEEIKDFLLGMTEEEKDSLANNIYDYIKAVKIDYLKEIGSGLFDLTKNLLIIKFTNRIKLLEFAAKFIRYKAV